MTHRAALLACLIVLSSFAVAVPAGATPTFFGVTDVTVSPSTPAPGETAIVSINIANFENSQQSIDITDIAIRTSSGDSFTEHQRVEDVGKLAPGADFTIPLSHEFKSEGIHTLRVHIWARVGVQREHITYPVTVRVRTEHPSLELEETNPIANTRQRTNVTIHNGLDSTIRDVSVQLHGADVSGNNLESTATIQSGASEQLSFDLEPAAAGERTVRAELTYTMDSGVQRTVNRTLRYDVDPLDTGVALDTERVGDGASVRATVSNLGNVPLERLLVSGTIEGAVVDRASLGTLGPGETTSVVLNATGIDGTNTMNVDATYRQAGSTATASASERVSGVPASIHLTGLDLEMENGKLHITGSTSNFGLTPASSVVVTVLPADGVTPAYPGRNYFVGTVPPSDFVSFDVYAAVTEDATSVPLEVTYIRNGEQQSITVDVPLAGVNSADANQPSSTGLDLPVIGIGVVVVLVVAGLIGLGWRNYRAGS